MTTLLTDSFNRADTTAGIGTAETGQVWTNLAGTWGIRSNKAYNVGDTNSTMVGIDINTTQYTFSVDVTGDFTVSNDRTPAVIFHHIDTTAYMFARIYGTRIALTRRIGSVNTEVSTKTIAPVTGQVYKITIEANDGDFKYYVDDVLACTYTLTTSERTTFLGATTRIGLRQAKGNGVPPTTYGDFDNFVVLGGPAPGSVSYATTQAISQTSSATLATKQVITQSGSTAFATKQTIGNVASSTAFATKQVIRQSGSTALATKQVINRTASIAYATKQVVNQTGSTAFATRQSTSQTASTPIATKQRMYQISSVPIATKQMTYLSGTLTAATKQMVYQSSSLPLATRQKLYFVGSTAYAMQQRMTDTRGTAVATRQRIYQVGVASYLTAQAIITPYGLEIPFNVRVEREVTRTSVITRNKNFNTRL